MGFRGETRDRILQQNKVFAVRRHVRRQAGNWSKWCYLNQEIERFARFYPRERFLIGNAFGPFKLKFLNRKV